MNTIQTTTLTAFERGRFARITGRYKSNKEAATAFGISENEYNRFKNLRRAKSKTVSQIRSILALKFPGA